MSGEFGNCATAHFMHDKVLAAAEDCSEGRYEVTCAFGRLLGVLAPIAQMIPTLEADGAFSADVGVAIRRGRNGIIRALDALMEFAGGE